jgi:predicted flap endonuclease-1-like 5' DNA nuclease
VLLAALSWAPRARASNYELEEVPMLVPAEEAGRLRAAGVATTFALLEKAGEPRTRRLLATTAHIPLHTLEGWVRQCDLMRLRGVGPDVARLLTAVGVLTVADLQKADPDRTEEAIMRVNAQQKLSENPPGKDHLAAWIAQAKNLPVVLK